MHARVLPSAGLRIDPEQASRSRMSHYTRLALIKVTEDITIPVPPEQQTVVTGVPPGRWLNFPSWCKDGTKVAFTVRSAGANPALKSMQGPCACKEDVAWSSYLLLCVHC